MDSNTIICPACKSKNVTSERRKDGWSYWVTCTECQEFSFWCANDMMGGAFYNYTLISSGDKAKKEKENESSN